MARRSFLGLGLAIAGGLIGAWLGPRVYEWFGSDPVSLDETSAIFQGVVVGGMSGGLIGFIALGRPRRSMLETALVCLGCLVAAVLFLTGLWYVGDFTNADGFDGVLPYFGILLMPLSIALIWFIARGPRGDLDRPGRDPRP